MEYKKVYMVDITLEKLGALKFENINEVQFIFSTKHECEDWLIKQGFVYGQALCNKYQEGQNYWFHQNNTDALKAYADIEEMQIADRTLEAPEWLKELC